jgi:RNAse (barnase) inhibitor barstar
VSAPERDPRNAPGDFYVVRDCCSRCGIPKDIAGAMFQSDDTGCWVARQPQDAPERVKMLKVLAEQDLGCVRYGGTDADVLGALWHLRLRDVADESVPPPDTPPVFVIDGERFSTLAGFFEEVTRVLVPGAAWGRNFDAFNDILRGGFGTPPGGFEIRWAHHDVSKDLLGRRDPAAFETLVQIIRTHGPGGAEAEDGVRLVLD